VKWLLVLAGAVLLLLLAWFLLGRSPSSSAPEIAFVTLEIPSQIQDKAALVKAAQQFLKVHLSAVNVLEGCKLLRVLSEGLEDRDWPKVQAAMFRGFVGLHRTSGSREDLEPVLGKLLDRFVRFGSVQDLETLIRSSNENLYWKARVDQSLLAAISKEVPASGFQESRILPILEAAVAQKDYARASDYVTKARFAEGVPDTARAPVVRLEAALRLYYELKGEKPPMAAVVRDWAAAPDDRLSGPLLIISGIDLARSGQQTLDFGRLKQALQETRSVDKADEYWKKVLGAYGELLPKVGSYVEARTIDALVGSYSEQFKNSDFERAFWTKLADENKTNTTAEGIWRAECLKHAFRATKDDNGRIVLLKRIAQEYQTYMPGNARPAVETLAAGIETGEGKSQLVPILDEVKKTEAAHQAKLAKLQQDQAQMPFRAQAGSLKRQVDSAKAAKASPQVIGTYERQIKELEKKLPE
jgi:hypothetical protein